MGPGSGCGKTRHSRLMLNGESFRLGLRGILPAMRTIRQPNRLPILIGWPGKWPVTSVQNWSFGKVVIRRGPVIDTPQASIMRPKLSDILNHCLDGSTAYLVVPLYDGKLS